MATELGVPHSAATDEVTDEHSVRALFDGAGALDIVVNTAGFSGVGLITDLPVEDFRAVVDVCLNRRLPGDQARRTATEQRRGAGVDQLAEWTPARCGDRAPTARPRPGCRC